MITSHGRTTHTSGEHEVPKTVDHRENHPQIGNECGLRRTFRIGGPRIHPSGCEVYQLCSRVSRIWISRDSTPFKTETSVTAEAIARDLRSQTANKLLHLRPCAIWGLLSSESEALKLDGLCSGLAYPRDGPGAAPERMMTMETIAM